mgnify:CR=1 FL=1
MAHRLLRYDTLCCDTLRCRLVAPTLPVRCVTIWYGVTRCSTLWAALCYVVWHCATFLIRCVTLWYSLSRCQEFQIAYCKIRYLRVAKIWRISNLEYVCVHLYYRDYKIIFGQKVIQYLMQKSGLNCYESFRLMLSCYSAVDRGFIVQVEIYIRYWMTFLSGIIYDLKVLKVNTLLNW